MMKVLKSLKTWFLSLILNNYESYYSEIDDIPLYNWGECEKGNIRYVNKSNKSSKKDVLRWSNLYNKYIDRYGLGEDFKEILRIKKKLIYLRCLYVKTSNKKILNQIGIDKKRLTSIEGTSIEGLTVDETLVHLSKWIGYRIDKKKISIVEYKTLIEEYGREHKKE